MAWLSRIIARILPPQEIWVCLVGLLHLYHYWLGRPLSFELKGQLTMFELKHGDSPLSSRPAFRSTFLSHVKKPQLSTCLWLSPLLLLVATHWLSPALGPCMFHLVSNALQLMGWDGLVGVVVECRLWSQTVCSNLSCATNQPVTLGELLKMLCLSFLSFKLSEMIILL